MHESVRFLFEKDEKVIVGGRLRYGEIKFFEHTKKVFQPSLAKNDIVFSLFLFSFYHFKTFLAKIQVLFLSFQFNYIIITI